MISVKSKHTHWITTLSVVLSLSILLPFCCHTTMAASGSHHKMEAMASHHASHNHQPDSRPCNCGHQLTEAYQRPSIATIDGASIIYAIIDQTTAALFRFNPYAFVSSISKVQRGVDIDLGPPLHIVHSLFLH